MYFHVVPARSSLSPSVLSCGYCPVFVPSQFVYSVVYLVRVSVCCDLGREESAVAVSIGWNTIWMLRPPSLSLSSLVRLVKSGTLVSLALAGCVFVCAFNSRHQWLLRCSIV